ncbi:MAG: 30S ribosomal protein S9 [Gemmatimonadota bacterium]
MTEAKPVQAVGRRKSAVARVSLRQGGGSWKINGRELDDYFPLMRHRSEITKPLVVTDTEAAFDVRVRVRGGGPTGQAEAVRLAVARALLADDEERRGLLRSHDLLTRDPRVVERKKPGRPKARKRFQFSKR